MKRIIFLDVPMDDMILAMRAVKAFIAAGHVECIYAYGETPPQAHFYVKRNKASITVRPL